MLFGSVFFCEFRGIIEILLKKFTYFLEKSIKSVEISKKTDMVFRFYSLDWTKLNSLVEI